MLFDLEWFERSRAATAGLAPGLTDANARLQFDAFDGDAHWRWVQVIEDGQLIRWEPGELSAPDAEVTWSFADARDVLAGKLDGTTALAAMHIVAPTSSGVYRGRPPPLDIDQFAGLAELPTIEGATLTVQFVLADGPFGDVNCAQFWVDGRLNRMALGTVPDPDVLVRNPYWNVPLLRDGSISALEGLEQGGGISGSTGSLAAYAGLLESEPFQKAQRACANRAGRALAVMGKLNAAPGYRAAIAEAVVGATE